MLSIRYSDPPETEKETKARKDSEVPEPKNNFDITNYVQKLSWSGDSQQAARKLEFSIAYNTPDKDKTFVPPDLKIGGFIYLFTGKRIRIRRLKSSRGASSTGNV